LINIYIENMSGWTRRDFVRVLGLVMAQASLPLRLASAAGAGSEILFTIGKDLPSPYPHRIVPAGADLARLSELFPLFFQLLKADISTPERLQEWLLDSNDVASTLAETGSKLYILMTCHTDQPACEKQYLKFVKIIQSVSLLGSFILARKYLASPARPLLPKERFLVLDREIQDKVGLFHLLNIPAFFSEERQTVEYQKIQGAMIVNFRGKDQTMQEMGTFLQEPDRNLRQSAFEAMVKRRLQDRAKLEKIFEKLLSLRRRIARNAGFANYRDYAFKSKGRYDYGPEQCLEFHAAVEKVIMPLQEQIYERRRKKLGLAVLRPWDLGMDAGEKPPLRPFTTVERLIKGCVEILGRIHTDFAKVLTLLDKHQLLDLASRKGKRPGAYQAVLAEHRLPFIFANSVGTHDDVVSLLHECGHAIHSMECREEPLLAYREVTAEFAELASQSMELLGCDHFDVFYNPEDARRAYLRGLEGYLLFLPWCAQVDAFQHWLYTHPGHQPGERTQIWIELTRRFGPKVDKTGWEEAYKTSWQRLIHIFNWPFYYIEYGISLLGALQVYQAAKKDKDGTIIALRRAFALGGSRPLPELFATAGLKFDFSEKTLRPIAEDLAKELEIAN
jgi:oligoendopeptidase F